MLKAVRWGRLQDNSRAARLPAPAQAGGGAYRQPVTFDAPTHRQRGDKRGRPE